MNNKNSSFSSIWSIFATNPKPSILQSRALLEMFKLGEGSYLGIPSHVGSMQIAELKFSGLIDMDRLNRIYPTKFGKRLLENMILGEDDCIYPLKEAGAAEKFKKGIPLHLLAKSSSIARM